VVCVSYEQLSVKLCSRQSWRRVCSFKNGQSSQPLKLCCPYSFRSVWIYRHVPYRSRDPGPRLGHVKAESLSCRSRVGPEGHQRTERGDMVDRPSAHSTEHGDFCPGCRACPLLGEEGEGDKAMMSESL
jgi:hypothetical protein